jgi:hypothetical protein
MPAFGAVLVILGAWLLVRTVAGGLVDQVLSFKG